jgi:hypothetical protein
MARKAAPRTSSRGGDGGDDLVLAAEIAVDRPGGQVRLAEHVLHGGGMEAVADKAAPGGVQDLAPPGVEVGLGNAGQDTGLGRSGV